MDIRVASHRHDCVTALANLDAISAQLVEAKTAPGYALCECIAPPRKLQIRQLGARLFLAVWPYDGGNHHYACPFHRAGVTDSDGGDHLPAVAETDQGFDIATDFLLRRPSNPEGPNTSDAGMAPARPRTGGSHVHRARASLLAVLRHLWLEAGLHHWSGGQKRDWWRVTHALLPVIEHGSFAGRPMTQWLYLVPEFQQRRKEAINAALDRFQHHLSSEGDTEVRFGVVIGEASLFEKSPFGYRLTLRHLGRSLFMSAALREMLTLSYPRAFHQIGAHDGQRVVCIALVEASPKGYLSVIDIALMATSPEYIPVDSAYEAKIAQKLVLEGRIFSKPMRMESSATTLPDFVLSDTSPAYVMEIWGMTTAEYVERKNEKMQQYQTEGKPVWSWNAATEQYPPRFPARAVRGAAE